MWASLSPDLVHAISEAVAGDALSRFRCLDLAAREAADERFLPILSLRERCPHPFAADRFFLDASLLPSHVFPDALRSGALPHLITLGIRGLCDAPSLQDFVSAGVTGALPGLRALCLSHCRFGDDGATIVAAAVSLGAFPRLTCLDLSANDFGDNGIRALMWGIRALPDLSDLCLGFNDIGNKGVRHIAEAALMHGAMPSLRRLNLTCNAFSRAGISMLAVALAWGAFPALETIHLDAIDGRHPIYMIAVCDQRSIVIHW